MRCISKGMQVYYGLPVFITISPDEKNEGIMFRLMRVRQSDPAWIYDEELRSFAGPNSPKFLEEDIGRGHIPGYEARRAALAQKPQAAALGFRVHLTLLLRAAFRSPSLSSLSHMHVPRRTRVSMR